VLDTGHDIGEPAPSGDAARIFYFLVAGAACCGSCAGCGVDKNQRLEEIN